MSKILASSPPEGVDEGDEQYDNSIFNIDGILGRVTANKRGVVTSNSDLNFLLDDDNYKRKTNRPATLSSEEKQELERQLEEFMISSAGKTRIICPICSNTIAAKKRMKRHFTSCYKTTLLNKKLLKESGFIFTRNSFTKQYNQNSLGFFQTNSSLAMDTEDSQIQEETDLKHLDLKPLFVCASEGNVSTGKTGLDIQKNLKKNKVKLNPLEAFKVPSSSTHPPSSTGAEDYILNCGKTILDACFIKIEEHQYLSVLLEDFIELFLLEDNSISLRAVLTYNCINEPLKHLYNPIDPMLIISQSNGVIKGYHLQRLFTLALNESADRNSKRVVEIDLEQYISFEHTFINREITKLKWSRKEPRNYLFIGLNNATVAVINAYTLKQLRNAKRVSYLLLMGRSTDSVINCVTKETCSSWKQVIDIMPCASNLDTVAALVHERHVYIWNVTSPQAPVSVTNLVGGESLMYRSALWPKKADFMLFGGENGRTLIFDLNTGTQKAFLYPSSSSDDNLLVNEGPCLSEISVLEENEYFDEICVLSGTRQGTTMLTCFENQMFTSVKNNGKVIASDKYQRWYKSFRSKRPHQAMLLFFELTSFLSPPDLYETEKKSPKNLQLKISPKHSLKKNKEVDLLFKSSGDIDKELKKLNMRMSKRIEIKGGFHYSVEDVNQRIICCDFAQPVECDEQDCYLQWTLSACKLGIIRLKSMRIPYS